MSVRGPTSPSVRQSHQPAPATSTTGPAAQTPSSTSAQPTAPARPLPDSNPAARPQSAQATAQSRAEAQTTRAHDVTASQLQQRVTSDGIGHAGAETLGAEGHGVNRGASALRSASGPLPADAWSDPGRHILGHLTQHSARGAQDGVSDDSRCGPANLLGATIMQGREPTARLLERTAGDSTSRLSDGDRASLRQIASDVRGGRATYEQLSQAQDLIYRGGNTTQSFDEVRDQARARIGSLPRADQARFRELDTQYMAARMNEHAVREYAGLISRATGVDTSVRIEGNVPSIDVRGSRATSTLAGGFSDAELADTARRGGASSVTQRPLDGNATDQDGTSGALRAQLRDLRPGQSAIVRVAGSAESARSGVSDHFITIGRQPDGTPFIYNPDPSRGQATCYVGNGREMTPDFEREIRRYEGRVALSDHNGDPVQATVVQP